MAKLRWQVVRAGMDSAVGRREVRLRGLWWRRWLVLVMMCAGSGGAAVFGQASPLVAASGVGVFVDGGIQNVQYPAYADNSAGGNAGAFVQPHLLVGVEMRGGMFPVQAKYTQAQFTAGWRLGLKPGSHLWMPYVYGGGGYSRAQDLNSKANTMSYWDPCWQVSVGVDRSLGRNWSMRLFEVSYRRTYTPLRTLRSAEATVGLVYEF